ncbi:hypothetical protein BBO99_00000006 [Phytophthora kernoviae]|uniref:Uncharacterized protein n=1 Tax=Phytophthora kernoviae TaxID=325452 RepID=A0A421H3N4_9STRA|nr:hypothetical protein JM18_000125 [Phytophthora kernoviae]RLN26898.1 hypothetical protein BBI17_000006 [Phytophthora kernoviae]RLN85955.1 hypothetical protein BBO99_00000006 [Phytophthora kernoviae]
MLSNPNKLRKLNIGGCRRIGDEGLLEIVKVCTGLQHVNIRLCDRMTDLSVRTLTHNCLELEDLNVEELDSLSYKTFVFDQEGDGRAVVDKNLLLKLKTLNVAGCTGLNDLTLGHLVRLELAYCRELTDSVLYVIAKHLSLEELNLARCIRITDDGMLEIAAGMAEDDELSLLRAENALLRKKVKALEKGGRGDKPGLKLVVDEKEIQEIDKLLKKAEVLFGVLMETVNYSNEYR